MRPAQRSCERVRGFILAELGTVQAGHDINHGVEVGLVQFTDIGADILAICGNEHCERQPTKSMPEDSASAIASCSPTRTG